MGKRRQDLADVFHASGEAAGVYADIQLLGLNLGLGYIDGQGFGLFDGELASYRQFKYGAGIIGRKSHSGYSERQKAKVCDFHYLAPVAIDYDNPGRKAGGFAVNNQSSAICAWNLEISLIPGVGLRAGINVAELADFIVGWSGYDFLKDDHLETWRDVD